MTHRSSTLSQLRAGELAGCKRLDLSANLTEFPREILELADSLEVLTLSGNQLSELPDDFCLLRQLRVLFLTDNAFRHLPAVLGACERLEMIGFKGNQIEFVDDAAFPATLRWLILTDNRIDQLPPTLGNCQRLQKLMLAGNRLESLPASLAACENLELIRLGANRFQHFPDWLFRLPRLAWLGLGGNPWSEAAPASRLQEVNWKDLEIGAVLGQGASGVIHQARWHESGSSAPRAVAVKIFKGGMTSDGLPESEVETSVVAGNHPHLIGAIGRIRHHPEGKVGLLLPLVAGDFSSLAAPPDWESCTRDVYPAVLCFTPAEVLQAASSLAAVGMHLHSRRILHGDFYAHNILRNQVGECLLGDFGAAANYPTGAPVERVEVRAFGCLLGELLERMDPAGGAMAKRWWDVQRRCVASNVESRPDFKAIVEELAAASGSAQVAGFSIDPSGGNA
jgi:hypothetical protein